MSNVNDRLQKKLDSLKYHGNLSTDTVNKMSEMRAKIYALAGDIFELGESHETNEAFTHLETAQMFINKHLCLIDPQAVKEDIKVLYSIEEEGEPEKENCCNGKSCDESPEAPAAA